MQVAKKWLAPEDTQLPSDVSIPAPTALVATHTPGLGQQSFFKDSATKQLLFPAVKVPANDMRVLAAVVQLSMAQALADPITQNQQWQHLAGSRLFSIVKQSNYSATAVLLSPCSKHVLPALLHAISLKPAVIICFVPALVLSAALHQLIWAHKQQQLGLAVRAEHGWWLIITRRPLNINLWLH
jgi:hypothetical protein